MTTYAKNTEDRKTIVNRIGELTGEKLKYTMPGFTYKGQGFTVTKDGILEADDTADSAVLKALIAEGLILAPEEAATEPPVEEPTEAPTEPETAEADEESTTEEETDTEPLDAPQGEETAEDGLTISVPMTGHTGTSLRNLISMLYSRGGLISKATGGTFSCTEELTDALREEACVLTTGALRKAVADFEAEHGKALRGLFFEDDRVSFTGFRFTEDADKVQAFQQLVCQMNKLAKEQKRTLAREVDESNERYIFRIWLLRLGMAGSEFKTARRVLLSPLSGNAAFKDSAMEERWKANQNAKRDALRAAKAETGTSETAEAQSEEVDSDEVSA